MSDIQDEPTEGSTTEVEDTLTTDQTQQPTVPPEDATVFRGLRSLALQQMAFYVQEADELQQKIQASKTQPSVNLYTKKFNRVKVKFQDEVARLAQIEHTMKINNISLEQPEDETGPSLAELTAEDQAEAVAAKAAKDATKANISTEIHVPH